MRQIKPVLPNQMSVNVNRYAVFFRKKANLVTLELELVFCVNPQTRDFDFFFLWPIELQEKRQ